MEIMPSWHAVHVWSIGVQESILSWPSAIAKTGDEGEVLENYSAVG